MSPGHVRVQLPLVTVTLNVQATVLFEESVAVHVTEVVPSAKTEPDGGEQDTVTQFPVVVGAE